LLKHIREFDRFILITGFRNVKIRDTEEFLKKVQKQRQSGVEIQFFDAKYVASWQHLYFAALNALTAFKNKRNISKSLTVETMLYASAQRQIRKAVELVGITPKTSEIAVLIIGENTKEIESALQTISAFTNVHCDDAVLELSEEKKAVIQKAFGISELELKITIKKGYLEAALTNLVIERMALLATQR
jgi:KEOPS complex subunit Cgi121